MIIHIIGAIFVIGIIIFFHEAGHFLVARKVGVKVEQFAIGFGPKIISRKFGETEYSLRAIPLGGFIRMTEELHSQPMVNRFAITIAGPLMNFALALVLIFLLSFFDGVPTSDAHIGQVVGIAAEAGLQTGDIIKTINTEPVQDWLHADDLIWSSLEYCPEEQIEMVIVRNGKQQSFFILPEENFYGIDCIGLDPKLLRFRLLPSIYEGARTTGFMVWVSYIGLTEMMAGAIQGEAISEGVVGPVGMIRMIGEAAAEGVKVDLRLLWRVAFMFSIGIGIFNLFPIPGLDGSKLLFYVIEAIRGRPDPGKEGFIGAIGGLLLFAFFILITYRDIIRLFS